MTEYTKEQVDVMNAERELELARKELVNKLLAAHVNAELTPFPATLSPELLESLRLSVIDKGARVCYLLIDEAVLDRVLDNKDILALMDVPGHVEVADGHLGFTLGMEIYTDAYRQPADRILPSDHLWVMSIDGTVGLAVKIAA